MKIFFIIISLSSKVFYLLIIEYTLNSKMLVVSILPHSIFSLWLSIVWVNVGLQSIWNRWSYKRIWLTYSFEVLKNFIANSHISYNHSKCKVNLMIAHLISQGSCWMVFHLFYISYRKRQLNKEWFMLITFKIFGK